MKKIIPLLVFIFLSATASSQAFIDTTKVWNVAKCGWSMGQICNTYSYKFFGDTIINGITYKKLYSKLDSSVNNWQFEFAMRDSANKIYTYSGMGEELSYDFGANTGDTIKPYLGIINQPMIVDSIDTVLIAGIPKKRILFYSNLSWIYETWIEDIGSIYGVANPLSTWGQIIIDYSELTLCYWENNVLKYIDSTSKTCYINSTNINELNNDNFSVNLFPNPAQSSIELRFNLTSLKNMLLTIHNDLGETIKMYSKKEYIASLNNINIPISDLTPGIYFLRIYSDNNSFTKKFIKN